MTALGTKNASSVSHIAGWLGIQAPAILAERQEGRDFMTDYTTGLRTDAVHGSTR